LTQFEATHSSSGSGALSATHSDEIDLLQLFKSLLKTWKTWLLALIAVSVVFGAIKAVQILFVVNEAAYSKPIRLTFPNAHKLIFPSGAKFAYSDIVAPAVAKVAFERNKLGDYGLSIADLQGGLSATPYAPTYPLIIKKYEKLMSDKKLSADQIADLQKRLQEEVEQATSGEALVTLRLEKKELPQAVADKLMGDIPSIWAERALKEKGVLNINVQLASVNSLNADLISKADGLVAGDMLNAKIILLKDNIKAMSEFEGSQSIADPVSGMKLMDLSYAVDDFNSYVVNGLLAPIRLLGLSNNRLATSFYYEDKVMKMSISLTSLQRQSAAVKEVYNSYLQFERSSTQAGGEGRNGSATMVAPQLSVDMIDKLVGMSGDADREKYKQSLNDKRLALALNIADAESAISEAQLMLSALQKAAANGGKLTPTDELYLSKIKTDLPVVLAKLTDFFRVSERIYEQLSVESVGIKDQLYVPVTNRILVKKTLIDIKSTVLIWIALMFLTTVLVIPFCMIRNAMKARGLTDDL
jgi:hypothetical protein